MQKFKSKKGYILIEVVVSISLITLMFTNILAAKSNAGSMNKNLSRKSEEIFYFEALKNDIYYNSSFQDMSKYINKPMHISKENLSMEDLKNNSFITLLREGSGEDKPIVNITTECIDSILEIKLNLLTKDRKFETTIYKGDY